MCIGWCNVQRVHTTAITAYIILEVSLTDAEPISVAAHSSSVIIAVAQCSQWCTVSGQIMVSDRVTSRLNVHIHSDTFGSSVG